MAWFSNQMFASENLNITFTQKYISLLKPTAKLTSATLVRGVMAFLCSFFREIVFLPRATSGTSPLPTRETHPSSSSWLRLAPPEKQQTHTHSTHPIFNAALNQARARSDLYLISLVRQPPPLRGRLKRKVKEVQPRLVLFLCFPHTHTPSQDVMAARKVAWLDRP